MAKKDFAQIALDVVRRATGEEPRRAAKSKRNAGGKARANALSDEKRSEIARVAAAARWKKR